MEFSRFALTYEMPIRLGFFLGVFAVMALWEWVAPRRMLTVSKVLRWVNNFGIVFLSTVLLRVLLPTAAVGVAMYAQSRGLGLFNDWEIPYGLAVLSAIIVLEVTIYLQHVAFHAVPVLWRLHRVHHADLDFDVTTGARFHPFEILLSMLIKFAVITALGAPPLAVVIFEILLNASSMFNHSNVRIPLAVDSGLRWLIVTPDMHRVHHSVERDESNNNFGFILPWWDRLLGTYRSQPRDGHEGMTIGIDSVRDLKSCGTLWGMLTLPFVGNGIGDSANLRQ